MLKARIASTAKGRMSGLPLGAATITVGSVAKHSGDLVYVNHTGVDMWGKGFYATPDQGREIAAAIVAAADEVDARRPKLPEFLSGAIVSDGTHTPFMLRSNGEWISSGTIGPKHDKIVELITEAHAKGALTVLYDSNRPNAE